MDGQRVVIAGGSGFIGSALAKEFSARGFQVVVLTRSPRGRPDAVEWDAEHVGPWSSVLDGAGAVINLAGKVVNCPHTPENLREITASRVNSVNALADAIAKAKNPPRVWLQASAVGFYGDTGDIACDETSPAGKDILADICQKWESAFAIASLPHTRKVTFRIGVVLGCDGGALPVLSKLTRLFLGGAAGSGRQYISWIHIADLTGMFSAAVADEKISGVYNAVAPNPVTNADFMRELRRVLRRPWSPPAPAFAVKLGARLMGTEGSLALVSQRCVPKRILETDFRFRFSELTQAIKDLC